MGYMCDALDTFGEWFQAKVIEVEDNLRVKIHYHGWPARYDEWLVVTSERLAPHTLRSSKEAKRWRLRRAQQAEAAEAQAAAEESPNDEPAAQAVAAPAGAPSWAKKKKAKKKNSKARKAKAAGTRLGAGGGRQHRPRHLPLPVMAWIGHPCYCYYCLHGNCSHCNCYYYGSVNSSTSTRLVLHSSCLSYLQP